MSRGSLGELGAETEAVESLATRCRVTARKEGFAGKGLGLGGSALPSVPHTPACTMLSSQICPSLRPGKQHLLRHWLAPEKSNGQGRKSSSHAPPGAADSPTTILNSRSVLQDPCSPPHHFVSPARSLVGLSAHATLRRPAIFKDGHKAQPGTACCNYRSCTGSSKVRMKAPAQCPASWPPPPCSGHKISPVPLPKVQENISISNFYLCIVAGLYIVLLCNTNHTTRGPPHHVDTVLVAKKNCL